MIMILVPKIEALNFLYLCTVSSRSVICILKYRACQVETHCFEKNVFKVSGYGVRAYKEFGSKSYNFVNFSNFGNFFVDTYVAANLRKLQRKGGKDFLNVPDQTTTLKEAES